MVADVLCTSLHGCNAPPTPTAPTRTYHPMAMAEVARPVLQELNEPDDLLSLNTRKPSDALKMPVAPIRHKRPRLSLSPPLPKRRLCLGLADSPPAPAPPRGSATSGASSLRGTRCARTCSAPGAAARSACARAARTRAVRGEDARRGRGAARGAVPARVLGPRQRLCARRVPRRAGAAAPAGGAGAAALALAARRRARRPRARRSCSSSRTAATCSSA